MSAIFTASHLRDGNAETTRGREAQEAASLTASGVVSGKCL
jgi:hypothetical protein